MGVPSVGFPLSTNGMQITATTTATDIKTLILTADSSLDIPSDINYIEIQVDSSVTDAFIRYSKGGGDPSLTKGMELLSGQTRIIAGTSIEKVKIIGSNVLCNVDIGHTTHI